VKLFIIIFIAESFAVSHYLSTTSH